MKALILAAGFGTRLAPYTDHLPKPLFTVNNRTVLDLAIESLIRAGCDRIFVNTHHLAPKIQAHLEAHPAAHLIETVHEPVILDTGGAIANLRDRLRDGDFLVINADIVHNLDLTAALAWHKKENALATLVLHNCPKFNKVTLDADNRIKDFSATPDTGLAFTGLQILSPEILDFLPDRKIFSSIDLYRSLCPTGKIKGYLAQHFFWQDMGTPESYRETTQLFLAGQCFGLDPAMFNDIRIQPLAGDGSDRRWFRASYQDRTIILSDHGICLDGQDNDRQLSAFVRIGSHLNAAGINTPEILGHDRVSGQVAVQDLGGTHLADLVPKLSPEALIQVYSRVIDRLIDFSRTGIHGFNPAWTCQTPSYSKQMVLELECRYFLNAFINGYLERNVAWEPLEPAFEHVAENASAGAPLGLMHRDCQSRNIMVKEEDCFFIDFQSARVGPLAYDLASLLIDPYVTLAQPVQDRLLEYGIQRLNSPGFDPDRFRRHYAFCAIARNLQMLGAFGFLTRVKKKTWFETHIPAALAGLKQRLGLLPPGPCSPLADLVNTL